MLVFIRMELNHVGDLSVAKSFYTLTSLGVPELHLAVIATREETTAIVREANVLDGFDMAHESS